MELRILLPLARQEQLNSYVNFASDQMRTAIEIEKERIIAQFYENNKVVYF